MNNQDIDKNYISPYDIFLKKFDNQHELTKSQIKEIQKHQRIALLRDDANSEIRLNLEPKTSIWD